MFSAVEDVNNGFSLSFSEATYKQLTFNNLHWLMLRKGFDMVVQVITAQQTIQMPVLTLNRC